MEKQQAIYKMNKNRHLSSVAQILTQAKGPQKLKILVQKALDGCSDHEKPIIHGLAAFQKKYFEHLNHIKFHR